MLFIMRYFFVFFRLYLGGCYETKFFTEISSPIVCEYKSDSWVADHRTPFHFHDGYEILIFLSGNASFCIGQHEQFLTPGTIICCAPFSLHRALPHDPHNYDRILLHIRKDTLLSLSSTFTDLSTCFHASSQPIYSFSKSDLDNVVDLCKILKRIQHAGTFLSQGATLTDACFSSGFQTYSHFSKTFSAHFGISPKKYQQKYWQPH